MAASSACSDHCPLVILNASAPPCHARFWFESFWPKFPHFRKTSQRAWQHPFNHNYAFTRIKTRFPKVAKDLKCWSSSLLSDTKVQFLMANELILRLDVAMESRQLTHSEFSFRKLLKQRVVRLAAIARARRRQASRLTWQKDEDANTSFLVPNPVLGVGRTSFSI